MIIININTSIIFLYTALWQKPFYGLTKYPLTKLATKLSEENVGASKRHAHSSLQTHAGLRTNISRPTNISKQTCHSTATQTNMCKSLARLDRSKKFTDTSVSTDLSKACGLIHADASSSLLTPLGGWKGANDESNWNEQQGHRSHNSTCFKVHKGAPQVANSV